MHLLLRLKYWKEIYFEIASQDGYIKTYSRNWGLPLLIQRTDVNM